MEFTKLGLYRFPCSISLCVVVPVVLGLFFFVAFSCSTLILLVESFDL